MLINRRHALLLTAGALFAATGRNAAATPSAVLRFAPHAALRVLDPVTTNAYITRNHGYLVYDTLFSVNAAYEPQPQMVASWEAADDGLSYSFTLREGLAFHDGAPVTAEDCVASIRRWWQRDVIGVRLQKVATSLQALDDRSFRIELSEPFGIILQAFAKPSSIPLFVMPKRIAELPPATVLEEVVGSGPFRFLPQEFRPGVSWAYARNEAYVPREEPADGLAGGKVARVERIEVVWFPSPETAISALQRGEIDLVESVSPDRRGMLDGTPMIVRPRSSPSASTIRFNWSQPPFDDVRVRQAVQAVVTQQDYMDVSVGDPEAYRLCPALFGCDTPLETAAGAIDDGTPDYERARALLADSSYAGQKVVIITPGDVASFAPLAPLTQQILGAIGIDSEIQTMEWSAFLARRARTDPPAEGGWNLAHAVFDRIDLISPLGNMNFDARGPEGYTGFVDDPATEELKTRYQREADPARQLAIAEEMQLRAYEQVFYIPLGTYWTFEAFRPEVEGYLGAPVQALWEVGKA